MYIVRKYDGNLLHETIRPRSFEYLVSNQIENVGFHLKPFENSRIRSNGFKTIQIRLKPFESGRIRLKPSESNPLKPFETIRINSNQVKTVWIDSYIAKKFTS